MEDISYELHLLCFYKQATGTSYRLYSYNIYYSKIARVFNMRK